MEYPYEDLYRIIEFKLNSNKAISDVVVEKILSQIKSEKVNKFLTTLHSCSYTIAWFLELFKLTFILMKSKCIFDINKLFILKTKMFQYLS